MKKVLLVLAVCVALFLVACQPTAHTVAPQDSEVTVSFVVDEQYLADDVEEFVLPARTIKAGEALGALSIPEGTQTTGLLSEYYELVWCYDQAGLREYDPTAKVEQDTTLYLVQKGLRYRLTYHYDPALAFVGEFADSYRYGEAVALPNVDMGDGYRSTGNWYYDEEHYYTVAVPAGANGDLELTFRPDPVSYRVYYRSGLSGVAMDDLDNPNPDRWTIVDGKRMSLLPASYEGKTFAGWRVRLNQGNKITINVDGEDVTYTHLQKVTQLDFAFIQWGQFVLEGTWE